MRGMRSLGDSAQKVIASMGGDPAAARKAARGARVRTMWRTLMEHNHDEFILEHTNNVFIIRADGTPRTDGKRYRDDGKDAGSTGQGKQLIVYVDDSVVAAELNARRELIKLQFMEHFREDIDEFKIIISRGNYKKIHPFAPGEAPSYEEEARPVALDDAERAFVHDQVAKVEDPKLAKALERAMVSDMEWKKGLAAQG